MYGFDLTPFSKEKYENPENINQKEIKILLSSFSKILKITKEDIKNINVKGIDSIIEIKCKNSLLTISQKINLQEDLNDPIIHNKKFQLLKDLVNKAFNYMKQ